MLIGAKILGFAAILTALVLCNARGLVFAASAPHARVDAQNLDLTGQWRFGRSPGSHSPIWIKGLGARDISNKARPKIDKKNAADTSSGIDAALSRAEKRSSGKMGIKMKNETSSWRVTPDQQNLHPDENIAREGRHVFGAYAGLKGEDLNISIGPELIIKDEQNVREHANVNQPDTALGLGMNFKFDF